VTHPTSLNPWFTVARLRTLDDGLEYYAASEGPEDPIRWTPHKREAMLFLNLHTAVRVRDVDGDAIVIVLASKDDLREYGRG